MIKLGKIIPILKWGDCVVVGNRGNYLIMTLSSNTFDLRVIRLSDKKTLYTRYACIYFERMYYEGVINGQTNYLSGPWIADDITSLKEPHDCGFFEATPVMNDKGEDILWVYNDPEGKAILPMIIEAPNMLKALENVLKASTLWVPKKDSTLPENRGEAIALNSMKNIIEALVNRVKGVTDE